MSVASNAHNGTAQAQVDAQVQVQPPSMVDAARLNNEGAAHFANGDWPKALMSFRKSLERTIAHVRMTEQAGNVVAGNLVDLSNLPLQVGFLDGEMIRRRTVVAAAEGGGAPHLFEHPLVFLEADYNATADTHNPQMGLLLCGAVIFNMAIVCHVKAMQGDIPCVSKALQLYDSSIGFFRRILVGEILFAGIVSAALNNKIRIYHEDCRFDELERDAHRLSQTVAVAYQNRAPYCFLHGHEFEAILLNLMLLKRSHLAQAA